MPGAWELPIKDNNYSLLPLYLISWDRGLGILEGAAQYLNEAASIRFEALNEEQNEKLEYLENTIAIDELEATFAMHGK